MRVTQTMLAKNSLNHIQQGYQNLARIQDQLSTGKKITRASQDPVVAMNGMRYRTQVIEVTQFKRNLNEAYNWIDQADASLTETTNALQRIRELTVQASNGTNNNDQLRIIATEIRQLQEHLASLGNSKVGEKYIFNGTNTTEAPISVNPLNVSTNTQNVEIELFKGVNIPVNIRPQNVYSEDLFTDIEDLINALNNGAESIEITAFLTNIDKHIGNVTTEQAELGARMNRMEMMEQRIMQQEVTAKRIMSENEDTDLEEVIINLTTQESVHRAAMAVGARILQPSLLDFLR